MKCDVRYDKPRQMFSVRWNNRSLRIVKTASEMSASNGNWLVYGTKGEESRAPWTPSK